MNYAKKRYYELSRQGYRAEKSKGDSFGESPYWEYWIITPLRGKSVRFGKEILGLNPNKHGGRAEADRLYGWKKLRLL